MLQELIEDFDVELVNDSKRRISYSPKKHTIIKENKTNYYGKFTHIVTENEIRSLVQLRGIKEVPQFIEKLTPSSFEMTFVEGEPLSSNNFIGTELLEELILKINRRGVLDLDLNDKDILVTSSGYSLVDFGASFRTSSNLVHRLYSKYVLKPKLERITKRY